MKKLVSSHIAVTDGIQLKSMSYRGINTYQSLVDVTLLF